MDIAAWLQEKGIQHGDRIGILMENIPQWVFVLLGAMRIGAITVPLATTLPENSIHIIAEHAGCKIIFADDANWEKASAVTIRLGIAPPVAAVRDRQARKAVAAELDELLDHAVLAQHLGEGEHEVGGS